MGTCTSRGFTESNVLYSQYATEGVIIGHSVVGACPTPFVYVKLCDRERHFWCNNKGSLEAALPTVINTGTNSGEVEMKHMKRGSEEWRSSARQYKYWL